MRRKILGYKDEEEREEWKKAWTKGSSIFLFLAKIRKTRPRMTNGIGVQYTRLRNKLLAMLFSKICRTA